ncbi:MAG TPA: hypothetical protein VHO06_11770 [Polyangia bacterium]|nr:hypothetical protein [Polyangia bacterium]
MRRRRTPSLLLAAALAALGSSACVSGFDRNDQTVNSLRILGAAAHIDNGDGVDWADAEVGDTVTFEALVANPTGVPDVTVTWVTCLPSLNATVTPCTSETVLRRPQDLITMATDPANGVIELGVGEKIQYTVPQEVQPLLDALVTRADQNVNAQCSLYIEAPVIVIVQGSDGSVVTAVKNLRLSPWSQTGPGASDPALQHYIRNANPSIAALDIPTDNSACAGQTLVAGCSSDADCGGATCSPDGWCPPAAVFPTGPTTICGQLPAADSQTYYYCGMDGVDGSEMEYPTITWYETAGTEAGISNSNTAGTPDLPSRTFQIITRPPGPFTLYGVVRDGRDGESWIAQAFQ